MNRFRRRSSSNSSLGINGISMPDEGAMTITDADPQACYEVLCSHWRQIKLILNKPNTSRFQKSKVSFDEAQAIINYAAQMAYLIVEEVPPSEGMIGRMLELTINENVMDRLQTWSCRGGEFAEDLKRELLRIYELLIAQAKQSILMHNAMLNPLLRLLMECHECSEKVEDQLVLLLHQLCVSLSRDPMLLEFLFHASPSQGPAKFLLFSLLVPYIHREGKLGMQARDALLLCIAVSRDAVNIGQYISESTNLCPVLAGGLGGRYSLLPRKLEMNVDHWHSLTREDWQAIPEMVKFLNTLEFCNAVVQVAHPLVGNQLVHFFHDGFLVPIIGPALHQFSVTNGEVESGEDEGPQDEIVAATAYVDLFLRSITEPRLMMVFLRYLCTGYHEGQPLLDSLIKRIGSNAMLCRVTLSLFHTMMNLNCEDVMFELVLKYLVPCNHIMVSQRKAIQDLDISGKWAEKFLSLTPACCINRSPPTQTDKGSERTKKPKDEDTLANGRLDSVTLTKENRVVMSSSATTDRPNGGVRDGHHNSITTNGPVQNGSMDANGSNDSSPSHHGSNVMADLRTSQVEYLADAKIGIADCSASCQYWSLPYDGKSPPPVCLSPDISDSDSVRVSSRTDPTSGKVTSSDSMTGISSVLSEELVMDTKGGTDNSSKGNTETAKTSPDASDKTPRSRSRTVDSSLSATIQEVLDFQIGNDGLVDTSDVDILELFQDDQVFLTRKQSQSEAVSSKSTTTSSNNNTGEVVKTKESSLGKAHHQHEYRAKGGARPKELKLAPVNGKTSISSDSAFSSGNSPLFEGFGSVSEHTQDGSPVAQWLRALGEDSGGAGFIDSLTDQMEMERRLSRQESVKDKDEPCVFWEFDSDLETTPRHHAAPSSSARRRLSTEGGMVEADRILHALGYSDQTKPQDINAKQMRFSFDVNSNTSTPRRVPPPSSSQSHGLSESPLPGSIIDSNHFSEDEISPRHHSLNSSLEMSMEINMTAGSVTSPGIGFPASSGLGLDSAASSSPLRPMSPSSYSPIGKTQGTPTVGPFIDAVFRKVENMMQNSLYINLLVTGLLTRLAYYPQPLLRSFLLNTSMVFQPSVRSLVQVLTNVRNSLDLYASSVPDFHSYFFKAKQYLYTREDIVECRTRSLTAVSETEQEKVLTRPRSASGTVKSPSKRSMLSDLLRRGNRRKSVTAAEKQKLNTIRESGMVGAGSNAQYEFLRNKNAVYCAVVFEEFLKELAAIAQEHAVAPSQET